MFIYLGHHVIIIIVYVRHIIQDVYRLHRLHVSYAALCIAITYYNKNADYYI